MMSTNTMSGWWSAILASASKPSIAVNTSHPSLASSVSAVRRMVLLSSMTSTLRPWSFVLLPFTIRGLLSQKLSGVSAHAPAGRAFARGGLDDPFAELRADAYRRTLHTSRSVSREPGPAGKCSAVLTYRYTPGYATRVTFFEARHSGASAGGRGQTYSRRRRA